MLEKIKNNFFWLWLFLMIFLVMMAQLLLVAEQLRTRTATDFVGIYTGSFILSRQTTTNIYDLNNQLYYQKQFAPDIKNIKKLMAFLYPPFIALLILPLTRFVLIDAYLLWGLFNLLLLFILITIVYKTIAEFISKEKLMLINRFYFLLMILLFPPIMITIIQGQFSILLLIIFWLGWYFLKNNNIYKSGLVMSLLLVRPHLLIVPTIVFFIKKERQFIFGLLSGIFLLSIVSIFFMGNDIWWRYVIFLKQILLIGDNNNTVLQFGFTARGLLQHIYHTNNILEIWMPLAIINLIIIFFLYKTWSGKLNYKSRQFDFQYGLLIMTIILLSPHFNYHDVSLLLLPFLLIQMFILNKIPIEIITRHRSKIPFTMLSITAIQSFIGLGATVYGLNSIINIAIFLLLIKLILIQKSKSAKV